MNQICQQEFLSIFPNNSSKILATFGIKVLSSLSNPLKKCFRPFFTHTESSLGHSQHCKCLFSLFLNLFFLLLIAIQNFVLNHYQIFHFKLIRINYLSGCSCRLFYYFSIPEWGHHEIRWWFVFIASPPQFFHLVSWEIS